jgi:putative hemolysin
MKKQTFRPLAPCLTGLLLLLLAAPLQARSPSFSITDAHNPHNLSAGGTGNFQASSERRVCIVCHTPHHASDETPLWSRQLSSADYTPYDSTTLSLQAAEKPDQPLGPSRLCLACHDGTIALGMLVSGGGTIAGLEQPLPANISSNLGKELADDHPISFRYQDAVSAGAELQPLPQGLALRDDRVECTACHDPHLDRFPPLSRPEESGKFLRLDNAKGSALCLACHDPVGWSGAAHEKLPGDACGACHQPHTAAQPARLLKGNTPQETCLKSCHSNIAATFSTAQAHQPVSAALSGSHDAAEDPQNFLASKPHVECVDCHNPHRSRTVDEQQKINGSLLGVVIARPTGEAVRYAQYEYEICFKCHGEKPFVPVSVVRQSNINDQSLRFATTNPSFHPVLGTGRNSSVPSLKDSGLTVNSLIYCSDCHNNPDGRRAGGVEANGPHGSRYDHLLIANYEQEIYPQPYSDRSSYELCFRCHDPDILLDETWGTAFITGTGTNLHGFHVRSKGVSCSICHDPHGTTVHPHLINFATATEGFDATNASYSTGQCSVSCHGVNPLRDYR